LDFIFERVKDSPEIIMTDIEASDTKMTQIFGGVSVVFGLAVSTINLENSWSIDILKWTLSSALVTLVMATASYLAAAIITFIHLHPKGQRHGQYADQLWDKYKDEEVDSIKRKIVEGVSSAYEDNKKVLDKKSKTIKWGIYTSGAVVLLAQTTIILSHVN